MNPQGMYWLTSRANAIETHMEAISNNLANADTSGYKRDQAAFKQVLEQRWGVASESDEERFAHHEHIAPYSGYGGFHVALAEMGKDFQAGKMRFTGQDLDVSLANAKAFFSISTSHGERFSKAGAFVRNVDGFLVTQAGERVNGMKGSIQVGTGKVHIGEDGRVLVDNKVVDRLRIVEFPFPDRLNKAGDSLFKQIDASNHPEISEAPLVQQGALETSNVNTVDEMVRLILANRAYSSTQKALTTADEMNKKAIGLAEIR